MFLSLYSDRKTTRLANNINNRNIKLTTQMTSALVFVPPEKIDETFETWTIRYQKNIFRHQLKLKKNFFLKNTNFYTLK